MAQRTLVSEWLFFENAVLKARKDPRPELRKEAQEAFVGGMHAMFRIFTAEISQIANREQQRREVNDIHEQLLVLAMQAGQK